jgi:Sulfotransferase family
MLPDFLIIGAPRSATTSLHYYLSQHPAIAMSQLKEPNFFLFDQDARPLVDDPRIISKSVSDLASYERLFPAQSPGAIGEASPLYLYTHRTPELISGTLPDARLIAVVREPVERAYSHLRYIRPDLGLDAPAAFAAAVKTELPLPDQPYRSGTHNLRLGRYSAQLDRYLQWFASDRLLILRFRDIEAQPQTTLEAVCRFLGVDDSHQFDVVRRYASSQTSPSAIDRLMAPIRPHLKRALPPRLVGGLARARATRQSATGHAVHPTGPVEARPASLLPPDLRAAVEAYFAESNEAMSRAFGISF